MKHFYNFLYIYATFHFLGNWRLNLKPFRYFLHVKSEQKKGYCVLQRTHTCAQYSIHACLGVELQAFPNIGKFPLKRTLRCVHVHSQFRSVRVPCITEWANTIQWMEVVKTSSCNQTSSVLCFVVMQCILRVKGSIMSVCRCTNICMIVLSERCRTYTLL